MSRVARQKHIRNEIWTDDYSLPKENQVMRHFSPLKSVINLFDYASFQVIARILQPKGNNLHEVEPESTTEPCLASMPTKFRRNVWVKRGDFVLVEPIDEGDKVKVEIVRVLTPQHIKEYTKANIWPKKFTRKREHDEDQEEKKDNEDEDADSMDEEFQNPNRRGAGLNHGEEDEDTSDEEESG